MTSLPLWVKRCSAKSENLLMQKSYSIYTQTMWWATEFSRYLKIHEFYWILNVQVLNSQSMHAPLQRCSTVQRHQSPERPILHQISNLIYLKMQRRQVIMNVHHPSCVRPPQWSPPVLCRRFENGLASICVLIRSCKMPKESETTGRNDGWKWWLVGNATDVGISDKVVPTNVQDPS